MSDDYLALVLDELSDLSEGELSVIGDALRDWYETEATDDLPPADIAAAELRARLGLPDSAVGGSGEEPDAPTAGFDDAEDVVDEAPDDDDELVLEPARRPLSQPLVAAGMALVVVGLIGALVSWWRADMNIAVEQLELSGAAVGTNQSPFGSSCADGEVVIRGLIRSDSGVVLNGVTVTELAESDNLPEAVLVESKVRDRSDTEASSLDGYELAGGPFFNDQIELVYDVDDCEQLKSGLVGEPEIVVSYRYLGRDRQLRLTAPITTVQQSGGS